MKYFKIEDDSGLIGIATSDDLRVFKSGYEILIGCNSENAQYIRYYDTLYRDSWMKPVVTDGIDFQDAHVIEIGKHEFENFFVKGKS